MIFSSFSLMFLNQYLGRNCVAVAV